MSVQELLAAVPQLASLIEKGGVIGLLVIVAGFLGLEVKRLRRDINRVYGQRDFCRQVRARYKDRLDALGVKVDISDIEAERKEDNHDD